MKKKEMTCLPELNVQKKSLLEIKAHIAEGEKVTLFVDCVTKNTFLMLKCVCVSLTWPQGI